MGFYGIFMGFCGIFMDVMGFFHDFKRFCVMKIDKERDVHRMLNDVKRKTRCFNSGTCAFVKHKCSQSNQVDLIDETPVSIAMLVYQRVYILEFDVQTNLEQTPKPKNKEAKRYPLDYLSHMVLDMIHGFYPTTICSFHQEDWRDTASGKPT